MIPPTANDELDDYFLNLRAIKVHYCPLCKVECFEEDIIESRKMSLPLHCSSCLVEVKKQIELCAPLLSTIKF